jgi:RHS repeat-associated protein
MVITAPDAETLKACPAPAARGDDSDRPDDDPPVGGAPIQPKGPNPPKYQDFGYGLSFNGLGSSPGMQVAWYGYRFYDPVTGRWPSRDPAGECDGCNIYSFLKNGPLTKLDYLGLWTKIERKGGDWATTCAEGEENDGGWIGLAFKVMLDYEEVSKWVKNYDPVPIKGKTYYVPNVSAYYFAEPKFKNLDYWNLGIANWRRQLLYNMKRDKEKGFKIAAEYNKSSLPVFYALWEKEGIYKMNFVGHGYRSDRDSPYTAFLADPESNRSAGPSAVSPPYKLNSGWLLHCGAFELDWERHFVSHITTVSGDANFLSPYIHESILSNYKKFHSQF